MNIQSLLIISRMIQKQINLQSIIYNHIISETPPQNNFIHFIPCYIQFTNRTFIIISSFPKYKIYPNIKIPSHNQIYFHILLILAYIMLQFDQDTEKGLFTFYREQQEFQQQLAREKKQRIRKKKQKKEELQKQKIIILQEQQDKIHKQNANVTLIKANTQPIIRKNKLGTAVVVITSKHKKKKGQSLEKKPLSVMMFDPKIQRAPEFLLPKSEFAFNNSITDNHLELKEIYLSGLDQQLNAHINNSISQARQRRIHKKKYHHKEQKSKDKEDLNKYRIAIDSIAKGLLKDNNSILKLPSVTKNNSQFINNRISLNNDHKPLLKLNNSTSLQPKPKKRYSPNDFIDNTNIAKIQGLLSLQKYKDSIANTKQQQPYKSKSIVNKIRLQRSII